MKKKYFNYFTCFGGLFFERVCSNANYNNAEEC